MMPLASRNDCPRSRTRAALVRVLSGACAVALLLAVAGCGRAAQPAATKIFPDAPVKIAGQGATSKHATDTPPAIPHSLLKTGSAKSGKVIAFAFQARAYPGQPGGVDGTLLDAMRANAIPATFFMAGLWAESHPDVAARIAQMPGVEIGDGGYSAEYLRKLPPSVIQARTGLAQKAIHAATGITPRLYRDAQGGYGPKSVSAIVGVGLRPVSGDIDLTNASQKLSVDKIAQRALARVHAGSIIVLPGDGGDPRATKLLVRLLDGLESKGYGLVTISDLR